MTALLGTSLTHLCFRLVRRVVGAYEARQSLWRLVDGLELKLARSRLREEPPSPDHDHQGSPTRRPQSDGRRSGLDVLQAGPVRRPKVICDASHKASSLSAEKTRQAFTVFASAPIAVLTMVDRER